jgi:diaminohydroxyphosphoribosylaminopyrimidine deaminase/5-amino-6-(5-phosphoribosylamino)uracil reductase
MRLAIRLAERGRGKASPNPMVGAVVVRDGDVVGAGWHRGPGTPHAEVLALDEAGSKAKGATLYVTLEPCIHEGRTPPCVDAVIEADVKNVVVAMEDPDPRVSGSGIKALHEAGVGINTGVLERSARRQNQAHVVHRTERRPFVTYKAAVTFDGKTAAHDGSSKWVSGPEARLDVHRMRAASDAVCVGIGTVLSDDPLLTVRDVRFSRHPTRVVIDSEARTPLEAKVISGDEPTLILVAEDAEESRVRKLQKTGADIALIARDGHETGGISLKHAAEELASRDIVSMLLEGGARLAAGFEAAGLIDRYVLYVAPKLLGAGRSLLEGWSMPTMELAKHLDVVSMRRVGRDVRIIARSF